MKKIKNKLTEGKRSYKINVTTSKDAFNIPVIDVRDGVSERTEADLMIRQSKSIGGSKYLKSSFGSGGGCYQASRK